MIFTGSSTMGKLLSEAEIERFHRDGFVHPVRVMSGAGAMLVRHRLEADERKYGRLHYMIKPHLALTLADELAHLDTILDGVSDVLGSDLMLWDCAFIIKEPRTPSFVSWHQDLTYWGLDSDAVVSAWLALSPATVESGCMKMIPGSHRRGRLDHVETADHANVLSRGQTVTLDLADAAVVYTSLAPGEMSIHHGWTLHASEPNRSNDRRIGITFNFIRPGVRQVAFLGDTAMLVRGQDAFGHFLPEPRPTIDFDPISVAVQTDIIARRAAAINGPKPLASSKL
jgi:non-haem Fe2+, alpha-ketoglutarate-dependent halogenase